MGAPVWLYFTIPFISGLIGYVTNVVALHMTFYPIEFWGPKIWQPEGQPFGLFGWQGIIPAKAGKMAEILVTLMQEKLIDMVEVFSRLDKNEMSRLLSDGIVTSLTNIVELLGKQQLPTFWSFVPDNIRQEFVFILNKDIDKYTGGLMEILKRRILECMDLKHLVVSKSLEHKELVVSMFQSIGKKEFRFIRVSGFYFGFLFGIVQSGIFYIYDKWWLLPACGFLVGYATNWLALKVIFSPINPVKMGPITFQGLFLRRQDEVSLKFAELAAENFLRASMIWGEILGGGKFEAFKKLVEDYTHTYVQGQLGMAEIPSLLYLGQEGINDISLQVSRCLIRDLPRLIPVSYAYTEKALQVEAELCEKLRGLPSAEFEGVLHPVFQEDEIKLIIVGGVLGFAAGMLQVLTVL